MKKVAIVGFSDISRDLAPYDDPEFEIWGCNHVFQYAKRVDAIFEVHTAGQLEAYYGKNWPAYRKVLSDFRGRLVMNEPGDEFPHAERLPIEKLQKVFGFTIENIDFTNEPPGKRAILGRLRSEVAIFKSTISYMIALAILEGRPEIAIYGVDMSVDSEWFFQRHNLYFFLGWARAKGVSIVIPAHSHLMKEQGWVRLYGYDQEQAAKYKDLIHDLKLEVEQFDELLKEKNRQQEALASEMERTEGILQELEALKRSGEFNGHGAILSSRIDEHRKRHDRLREDVTTHLQSMHHSNGMREEAMLLAQRLGYHNRGEMPEGRA